MERIDQQDNQDKDFTQENWRKRAETSSGRNRSFFGLLIVLAGVAWLLRRMGMDFIPDWIFTWPMILIVIGLLNGFKHSFRNPGAFILLLIGGAFLVRNNFDIPYEFRLYFWPVMVIAVGLIILFRPRSFKKKDRATWKHEECESFNDSGEFEGPSLDSVTIFSGTKKEIISKNFRGGDMVTIFGGSDINLSQADLAPQAKIDLVTIFGGTKMIVPPHWNVVLNTTNIAGGVEDKRPQHIHKEGEPVKTLTIGGVIKFGGLELKSF